MECFPAADGGNMGIPWLFCWYFTSSIQSQGENVVLKKALEHIGTQKRRISCGAPLRSAPCGALPCGDHAAQINHCESRERDWRDEVLFKGTNRIFSLQVRLTVIMMV